MTSLASSLQLFRRDALAAHMVLFDYSEALGGFDRIAYSSWNIYSPLCSSLGMLIDIVQNDKLLV